MRRYLKKLINVMNLHYIGTSYNADGPENLLLKRCQYSCGSSFIKQFGYNMPILSEKPFFIFLSQSGETADSRQVLVQVNELGHPSLH